MIQKKEMVGIIKRAILKGSLPLLKILLDFPFNTSSVDENGYTLLYIAVGEGNERIVDFLLKKKFSPNGKSKNGETPLHLAVSQLMPRITEKLLAGGANPNIPNGEGLYPLHIAIQKKDKVLVQLLIKYGAKVDVLDSRGFPPLLFALWNKDIALFELLLRGGASLTLSLKNGKTVYDMIQDEGNSLFLKMAKRFLAGHKKLSKINPNEGGNRKEEGDSSSKNKKEQVDTSQYQVKRIPLKSRRFKGCFTTNFHLAAINGKLKEVKGFLAAGADPYLYDFQPSGIRALPIHYAAMLGHIEVVRIFLKAGVPILVRSMNGSTLLHFAIAGRKTPVFKKVKMVKFLLKKGIPVDIRGGSDKVSPLYISVQANCLEIAKILLKHGANPNFQNNLGQGPLHLAVFLGRMPYIQLLLKNGAKVNLKTKIEHFTPLHYAVRTRRHSSARILLYLLKHGADPNSQTKTGKTPLHIAMEKGKWHLAKILLNHGANPNLAIKTSGNTALHLLASYPTPSLEVAKLALSKGGNPLLKNKQGETAIDVGIKNSNASLVQLFRDYKSP